MIKNYFKIAWRNLIKQRLVTIINILGLSIGVCACLVIYIIVSFELSYDNFHRDKDRIYRVVASLDNFSGGRSYLSQVSYQDATRMRSQFSGIDKLAAFFNYYAKVTIPRKGGTSKMFYAGDPSRDPSDIIVTDPQYFDIFKYTWLAGNPETALNEPLKVVLTASRAKKYFGNLPAEDLIGREIIYNDSLRLSVSGIVKDYGKNTDIIFKDFISSSTIPDSFLKNIRTFKCFLDPGKTIWSDYLQVFVKLSPGVTASQIEAQTGPIIKEDRKLFNGVDRNARIHLQSLWDIHFNSDYSNDYYSRQASLPALYALTGIALFILIIAAINFINLSSAQSIRRAKEIGIRKVLGSSRVSLVLQFLSETFIITAIAVIISLVAINPVISNFKTFIPYGATVNLFNPSLIIFLILITIVTSLLAGLYPAKVLSSWLPVESLKGQGKQFSNRKSFFLKGLIVFQFAVSIIFVIGTIIVTDQVHFMLNKDMGFNKEAIIQFEITGNYTNGKRDVLAEKLRQLSGVEKVSISNSPPGINTASPVFLRRADNKATILSEGRQGDENYAPLYGLKLLAGRYFSTSKSDSINEFLITAACAKQLGFKTPSDAIGHMVARGILNKNNFHTFNTGPVAGVIADFHNQSLYAPENPVNIVNDTRYASLISIQLFAKNGQWDDYKTMIARIQDQWKAIYPEEQFNYSFYDKTIASFYEKDQRTSQIINAAMLIAIFISCIGLFGLVTFTAAQRTREIGIRKVLGASVASVTAMLAKEFVLLIGLAFLIACPVTWYFMQKWLQGFAFRINISVWVFVLAGASTLVAAIATISYQSIRAALANPVKSLKTE